MDTILLGYFALRTKVRADGKHLLRCQFCHHHVVVSPSRQVTNAMATFNSHVVHIFNVRT